MTYTQEDDLLANLHNVPLLIGLRQQGHMLTVEEMLRDGKTWDEIGEAIGWHGPTVRDWWAREVVAVLSELRAHRTQLQAANTREVERRREAERERDGLRSHALKVKAIAQIALASKREANLARALLALRIKRQREVIGDLRRRVALLGAELDVERNKNTQAELSAPADPHAIAGVVTSPKITGSDPSVRSSSAGSCWGALDRSEEVIAPKKERCGRSFNTGTETWDDVPLTDDCRLPRGHEGRCGRVYDCPCAGCTASQEGRHTSDNAHGCCEHRPWRNCCDNHPGVDLNTVTEEMAQFAATYPPRASAFLAILQRHFGRS